MEFFKKTLDPSIALATIAMFDIFLFLLVGAWTVGGGETMMTGLIAKWLMGDALDAIPFWQLVFKPDAGYGKILGKCFQGAGAGLALAYHADILPVLCFADFLDFPYR